MLTVARKRTINRQVAHQGPVTPRHVEQRYKCKTVADLGGAWSRLTTIVSLIACTPHRSQALKVQIAVEVEDGVVPIARSDRALDL